MILEILTLLISPITGVVGFLVGRRKQNNDFIQELQNSINMLVAKNNELLADLVEIKTQNAHLLIGMEVAKVENSKLLAEVELLRIENAELRKEVADLNTKLENVKTITRSK